NEALESPLTVGSSIASDILRKPLCASRTQQLLILWQFGVVILIPLKEHDVCVRNRSPVRADGYCPMHTCGRLQGQVDSLVIPVSTDHTRRDAGGPASTVSRN